MNINQKMAMVMGSAGDIGEGSFNMVVSIQVDGARCV